MLRLFRIEWMKVKNYRAFWILFGAFIILTPLFVYFIAHQFLTSTSSHQEEAIKRFFGNPFTFPKIWHTSSYFGGLFFIMVGMLFILLITNEVQYKTHRQNIIDGWSRLDFLKAKLTMMIFLAVISTIVVFLTGLMVGMIYTPASSYQLSEGIHYIGYFALMATAYLMVAYVIAILIKRTGLSIIVYFAFVCIVDNLLWIILTWKGKQAGYYLPLESTDSLIPNPFKPAVFERRTVSDFSLVIAAAAYIILFGYFIASYFRRIDLKT
jgi:ABC-2 type transport system permease protein